ncbi:MAG: glycosyltransferase family 4 protein [Candidatus Zixiibacteriota bacterium]
MTTPIVLHIRGSDFYGSPERLIIGQMQYMSSVRSIAASFVKPGHANPFLERLGSFGMERIAVEDRHKFDWQIPGRLRAICATHQVDLIVTHEYKSAFYGFLARRKLAVPQICYFHGWTSEDARVRLYNALDRFVHRRAVRVVTVSKASAQRLVESGVPPDKIDVVYNAIDIDPNADPPERQPNAAPVIGVVGRLSFEKGVHDFIRALAVVRGRSHRFAARIIGSGPEETRLKQMTAQLGLTDVVSFEGFRSDLDQVYPRLDFLVMPSLSEGHPVVILEGWKHGLGIIATRAGGIPEVVEHEKTGLLADVGRPEQLAELIRRGIGDTGLMNRLGRAGFDRLKTDYSYRGQAARLEAIYLAVIREYREKTN